MQLTGDEAGIAALKQLAAQDKEHFKFLLQEARTNADRRASFKAPDGTTYVLRADPRAHLPHDDEPTTPEEDASCKEAWEEYKRGEYMAAEEAELELFE